MPVQEKKQKQEAHALPDYLVVLIGVCAGVLLIACLFLASNLRYFALSYDSMVAPDAEGSTTTKAAEKTVIPPIPPKLDREAYARKLLYIANNGLYEQLFATSTASSTASSSVPLIPPTAEELASTTKKLWPAKAAYPDVGALLPFNRIVAYYGNFYSTQMGVLGQYPQEEMLSRLKDTVSQWEKADPETPVIPAIDYIAMTAQGSAGADGTYRFRMPKDQIQHAIDLAREAHGITILEVQAGLSDLENEVESLEPYLKEPDVHLAIDPEFHMVTKAPPGTVIGSVDAKEVNRAAAYLATLVQENKLPPKILIVHRFTLPMVTHALDITPLPEVQIVMDMDGWGTPERKFGTYQQAIIPYPVQFTGFKLFYKNDVKPPSTHMLSPQEVLQLSPQPIFIQYQ